MYTGISTNYCGVEEGLVLRVVAELRKKGS